MQQGKPMLERLKDRILAAHVSEAIINWEREYLEERRRLLQEKISKLEEIFFQEKKLQEKNQIEKDFSKKNSEQEECLIKIKEDFQEKETRYINLLTVMPVDFAEKRYRKLRKARDLRTLSEQINELIVRVDGLYFLY